MTTQTRQDILHNDSILKDMYHSLQAQGVNVSTDRKTILDTFLTRRRYFDTNIFSTFAQGDDIKDLDETNKARFSRALSAVDQMPSMFSKGGNPTWRAVKDYALAGVSDPTNLLSVLAGAFTMGAGGAAVWGAKEAAKQGVKATMKAKVRALGNKAVLKSLAVEGGVAGTGGFGQALRRQNVDMDLGRRKKGDYNLLEAGTQGVLEGVLSPLAGAGINIGGTGLIGGVKGLSKATGVADSQAVANTQNFLRKWFLPQAGLDETSARVLELNESLAKPIREKAEANAALIERIWKRDFKENEVDLDLINSAMGNDRVALEKIGTRSPEMKDALIQWRSIVKEAHEFGLDKRTKASDFLRDIYEKTPNYVRDTYDKYTRWGREPFHKWLERPENIKFRSQFSDALLTDESLGIQFGLRDPTTKKLVIKEANLDDAIEKIMKEEYLSDPSRRSKYGQLKNKNPDLHKMLKQLWGLNANPAIRAAETITGIIEPVTDIRLAGSLADSLFNRGLAFIGKAGSDAARLKAATESAKEAGITEPLVKLVSKKVKNKIENIESPFRIRGDLYAKELDEVFVPESLAAKLKVMTENQQFITDNVFVNAMAATQGYLKKGKTVYSPYAHLRNFLGMGQYVINSGNMRGIGDYVKTINRMSKDEWNVFKDKVNRLGLKGSNVELRQILNRIEGAVDDPNKLRRLITGVGTLGVSELERTQLGKRVSRFTTGVYAGTDDLGKIMTFLSERTKAGKVWNAMDDVGQDASRTKFIREFGQPLDKQGKIISGKKLDDLVLDEMAAQKALNVVPIYSRIPKILEAMRGIPLLGSFTAFPAENLRNKYMILKLASEEIRDGFETGNKELVKTGANRLMAQGAMAGAATVAAYTYNKVMGTDKAMDMIRESSPEWEKYHALQVRPGKDGKLFVTDLSYLNPDQYVLDMIMPLMVTAANGEDITNTLDSGFASMLENMHKPFTDPALVAQLGGTLLDAIKGDTPFSVGQSLAKAYKIQEPGILKIGRELAGDFNVMKDLGTVGKEFQIRTDPLYYGEKRADFSDTGDLGEKLARYGIPATSAWSLFPLNASLKEREFDPKKQMAFTVRALLGDANKEWNTTARNIRARLQDTSLEFDFEGLTKMYEDALQEHFVAQQGVAKLANSYKKYMDAGKGDRNTRRLLNSSVIKEAGGLSSKEINNILRNRFTAPKIPSTLWRKLMESNPELFRMIPKYRRELNKIYQYYNLTKLSEEVPEFQSKTKDK